MIEVAKRLISVQEYYQMAEAGILKPTDKVELIHGEIIQMSPVGSKHASMVDLFTEVLVDLLRDQAIVRVQSPIHLNERSEPEPDISILRKVPDRYADAHPKPDSVILLIEVADTTYEYDSIVKANLYAANNIAEYWIIDLRKDRIEVYKNPTSGEYLSKEIVRSTDELSISGNTFHTKSIFS